MKKLFKILNGNKTIICLTISTVLEQAIKYEVLNNNKYIQFTIGILVLLGGGSLMHHAKKGYFKQNKGN